MAKRFVWEIKWDENNKEKSLMYTTEQPGELPKSLIPIIIMDMGYEIHDYIQKNADRFTAEEELEKDGKTQWRKLNLSNISVAQVE